MTDSERIEELRRFANCTWKDLAEKLDIPSAQTFTDIRSGRIGISQRLQAKILKAFPEIRKEWLVVGEGSMTGPNDIPFYDNDGKSPFFASLENCKPSDLINPGSWFKQADMALRNTGDAMKEYPDGCVLMLRRVTDRNLLLPGNNYVVETREFVVARRYQKSNEPHKIALYSSNTSTYPDGKLVYEPFEVPMESITRIFFILGYVMMQKGESLNLH